ncbi:mannose-1-phosphate guanylyltransferase/mannose-6-phosphate isomerase [Aquamicrobium soli]|uniref:mannose-1-phosphate guanylyltransferase n=1 Tax=Aquamicrobium soli TaxID=1811518 RepID=A0ABV7K7D1_9HYPH
MNVVPLILSGGSGTRLWPLSRASKPKQFLSFGGGKSLFQETVLRCRGDLFDPRPVVVGANGHSFLLAEDLLAVGLGADILLEPKACNSCAAIAAGCLETLKRSRDAVVLVLAADHHIPDTNAFANAVAEGLADAEAGRLVTFGVRPDRPATSYGYILPGEPLTKAAAVRRFVEKPDLDQAERYLAEGYLWNSGNFLFRATTFLEELERLQPDILAAVTVALETATSDLDFKRLGDAFAQAPSISVDYAVMERTDLAAVLPVDYRWSDVGSWDAVSQIVKSDAHGNTVIGDATILEGSDNVVHSQDRLTTLIGVNDMIVVSTRDCLLVAPKPRAEDVKPLVARLQTEARIEAVEGLQLFRPWGNYERLDMGEGYQVKRIVVKPDGILSLQKHCHRAEHWVVVQGRAEVTIDGNIRDLMLGQSVYVPLGTVHRLANHGSEPVILIEVQTGGYLGEDDIIRLEDVYNRESKLAG